MNFWAKLIVRRILCWNITSWYYIVKNFKWSVHSCISFSLSTRHVFTFWKYHEVKNFHKNILYENWNFHKKIKSYDFWWFFFRADHDDQDVLMFNRIMLPSYYGLLRMCCQQSRVFTRQLASHQNINWAFQNIAPYPTKYAAVSFLYITMKTFILVLFYWLTIFFISICRNNLLFAMKVTV